MISETRSKDAAKSPPRAVSARKLWFMPPKSHGRKQAIRAHSLGLGYPPHGHFELAGGDRESFPRFLNRE
jgi:hypothetical protein